MARLVLTLAAVLAMMASITQAQKEVVLVDSDNETNSSIDVEIDNGGKGGDSGKGGKGDNGGNDNGGSNGEENATVAKTTVEFQFAIDVAGKTIEEMRASDLFMGALKTVGAKMANTTADAVTVTLSSARRLALRAARRLAAVNADFSVEVADGEDATSMIASITNQGSTEAIATLLDQALTDAGIEAEFNTTVTSSVTTPVTNDPSNQNNNETNNENPAGETSKAAGGFGTFSLLVASAAALCSAVA